MMTIYQICICLFLAGIILSAFYYGHILTQVPGGILARKIGCATLLGISVCTSGLLTLLTPIAARAHVGVLIALRIVIGMAEVIDVTKMMLLLLFSLVLIVVTCCCFQFFRTCPHLDVIPVLFKANGLIYCQEPRTGYTDRGSNSRVSPGQLRKFPKEPWLLYNAHLYM